MKKILLWIVVPGVVLFLGFAVYTFSSIYKGVERITNTAKTEFHGDAVHSLIDLVNSDNHDFEEKNQAIWAIGQYSDTTALPFLEKLNSETGDDSIPFDRKSGFSKQEIERAIKWCTKGNSTSWMYRKIK